jgi:hypothetical protein
VPHVLHQLPIFRTRNALTLPGGAVLPILPYQIILWVSLAHKGQRSLSANTPRFPVVLDPGFNHNFLIQERHLFQWAGLHPAHFRVLDRLHAYGQEVPLHAANIWVHRNKAGERDTFLALPPFCLELDSGIGICPPVLAKPRLPLLGLRALFSADLQLALDCHRGYLSLRTARRFWFFR